MNGSDRLVAAPPGGFGTAEGDAPVTRTPGHRDVSSTRKGVTGATLPVVHWKGPSQADKPALRLKGLCTLRGAPTLALPDPEGQTRIVDKNALRLHVVPFLTLRRR